MGSRKEEERNEKIIRGLMKLPPNRRCINCNSVGPQYVCTNFWTFVCMTCSGIHREFTHRVKSVSMSKFISQEVEALQNGGNQRARDIYLKDWDLQRQRLPDSSNVDKIREFIKNVYVDRKYAGGKTFDKPPRDMQVLRNHEDTIRRPSSYHSYSESPPYDNQYEDRRYGKQIAATLSRKPGSDRGFFARKASSFVHSPCHLSDQMFEERFASEDSAPRVSDYSVSSGGDTFKSGTGSPNFHKGAVFGNPNSQPKTETHNFFVDPNSEKDAAGMPHPQRTRSLGNFGSMDYNSMSVKSYNSGSGLDVVSEPEQTAGSHHDKASSFSQSSFPVNYGDLDLFNTPEASASPPIDLFQLPATAPVSSENVFQTAASLMSHGNLHQPSPSSPSVDFFAGFSEQPPAARSGGKSPELPVPKNEGWAMFDTPQHAASGSVTKNLSPAVMPSGDLSVKFDQLQSLNTTMQWPLFENSSALSSVMSSQWQEGSHEGQSSAAANSTQLSPLLSCEEQESWNASNDFAESLSLEPQVVAYSHSATTYLHLGLGISERLVNDGFQTAALQAGFIAANLPNRDGIAPPYAPEEKQSHAAGRKSTNPFDLPYDSEVEQSDMFLDMISLQTALPNAQLPFTFLGGVSQVWFPQNPMIPYIPGTPQGGLAYMSGQAPSSQLSNVPTQGPLPSIGGNPFA